MNWSRRTFISATALAGATGAAGCLRGSGDRSGGTDPEGLTVSTLSVGGSPGGTVPVKPDGTVTLLDFFATWCAPCKPQMAGLREIRRRFQEVHMLSITNEDDEAAVRSFWRDYEGTWPVAMDPDLTTNTKYGAHQMPTLLVLDTEGREVWRHVGLAATDSIAEKLRTAGAEE